MQQFATQIRLKCVQKVGMTGIRILAADKMLYAFFVNIGLIGKRPMGAPDCRAGPRVALRGASRPQLARSGRRALRFQTDAARGAMICVAALGATPSSAGNASNNTAVDPTSVPSINLRRLAGGRNRTKIMFVARVLRNHGSNPF
jgi:hypothetical protein